MAKFPGILGSVNRISPCFSLSSLLQQWINSYFFVCPTSTQIWSWVFSTMHCSLRKLVSFSNLWAAVMPGKIKNPDFQGLAANLLLSLRTIWKLGTKSSPMDIKLLCLLRSLSSLRNAPLPLVELRSLSGTFVFQFQGQDFAPALPLFAVFSPSLSFSFVLAFFLVKLFFWALISPCFCCFLGVWPVFLRPLSWAL